MNFFVQIKKIKNSELLILLSVCMMALLRTVAYSYLADFIAIDLISKIVWCIEFVLVAMAIVIHDKIDYLVFYVASIAVLMLASIMTDGIRTVILLAMLLYACKDVNVDIIIKYMTLVLSAACVLVVICYYAGLFEAVDVSELYSRSDGLYRMSLGFSYVTYASNFFLTIVLCWLYLNRNKRVNFLMYLLMFAINYFLYITTDTRAVYYLVILVLLCGIICQGKKTDVFEYKNIRIISLLLYPAFAIIAIVTSYVYSPHIKVLEKINNMLSGRLRLGKEGLEKYGIHLLAQKIEFKTTDYYGTGDYFYIDSSYLQIALKFGLLSLVVILLIYMIILNQALIEKNVMFVFVMLIIGVHSIIDPQLFDVVYTPFILLFGQSLKKIIYNVQPMMYKRIRSKRLIKLVMLRRFYVVDSYDK